MQLGNKRIHVSRQLDTLLLHVMTDALLAATHGKQLEITRGTPVPVKAGRIECRIEGLAVHLLGICQRPIDIE